MDYRTRIRLTWWVPLMEQEVLTLPEHLSSPPVTRSLVLYVMFCRSFYVFLSLFFSGHCGVCSSSIYGFWWPLWPLQTLHTKQTEFFFSNRTTLFFSVLSETCKRILLLAGLWTLNMYDKMYFDDFWRLVNDSSSFASR